MKWLFVALLSFLFLLSSCSTDSKKKPIAFQHSPTVTGNAEIGKSLYTACIACHGKNAEGNEKFNSPALANLEGWYLYRQLINYKKGWRGDNINDTLGFQMSRFASILKDSVEVVNVVAYIKTLPEVKFPSVIVGDIQKGQHYYETICGSCHGARGKGNFRMNAPSVNAVEDWYIKRQIHNFRDSIRGNHTQDKFGTQMIAIMKLLPNEQAVNDVIAYVRSTGKKEEK